MGLNYGHDYWPLGDHNNNQWISFWHVFHGHILEMRMGVVNPLRYHVRVQSRGKCLFMAKCSALFFFVRWVFFFFCLWTDVENHSGVFGGVFFGSLNFYKCPWADSQTQDCLKTWPPDAFVTRGKYEILLNHNSCSYSQCSSQDSIWNTREQTVRLLVASWNCHRDGFRERTDCHRPLAVVVGYRSRLTPTGCEFPFFRHSREREGICWRK